MLLKLLPINNTFLLQYSMLYLVAACLCFLLIIFVYILISDLNNRRERKVSNPSSDDLKRAEEIKEEAYHNALKILDQARVKSLRILSESQLKAQESLDDIEDLNNSTKESLIRKLTTLYDKQENVLKQMNVDLLDSYKKAIEKESGESIKTLAETSEILKQEVLSEVEVFKQNMKDSTYLTQKELEERLRKSYEEVEKEIKTYKEDKIKSLNSKIFDVLAEVSTAVIGKCVDMSTSEKFIMDTLKEEMLKEGLSFKQDSSKKS